MDRDPALPFRYFKTSPEMIRLAVMLYARFPLSQRDIEHLLHERGIDICQEKVQIWLHRPGVRRRGDAMLVDSIRPSRYRRRMFIVSAPGKGALDFGTTSNGCATSE